MVSREVAAAVALQEVAVAWDKEGGGVGCAVPLWSDCDAFAV